MSDTTFLDSLVKVLYDKHLEHISNVCIVLPNKRAKVFLLEKIKNKSKEFLFAPQIISIEEFVQHLSGLRALDSIELIFDFYEVYCSLTSKDKQQTFEQFSNWGSTLLQDFNEIDRYLLDPAYVFSYLKDIEVLKRWELTLDDKTPLIEKQFEFWDKLPTYYENLSNHLLQKHAGYQGLIYREAIHNLEFYASQLQLHKVIFAGFNALNQAEEKIIQHLIALDKGEIYWDIDAVFLNDQQHDVGLFIRRFKNTWTHYKSNSFDWVVNEFSKSKQIDIIGTSKAIGQAKIVSNIISELLDSGQIQNLDKVAVVLGDENLLIPVLHSLPSSVESLNITMGYPAVTNPVQLLIAKLFKMHSNALQRDSNSYVLYYKDVLDILTNAIVENYLESSSLVNSIKRNNYTFITQQKVIDLYGKSNELFELLFLKWTDEPVAILQRINQILVLLKSYLDDSKDEDKIIKTFLHAIYKVINKLISFCQNREYVDSVPVLQSIYKQIIDLAEVSFEGEPLSGIQIMGVLESRVLDFETVIITSMNEGKFPAGKSSNSFIPFDVKLEIGLPTFKEKDAIYTYHFYHLLQRAKRVFLLYNTESEGLDGGEKSRFITQLEVEKQPNHTLLHKIIQPYVPYVGTQLLTIEKSIKVQDRLKEIATGKGFSPSALTTYIRNPKQFYFQRVLSIQEADEVEENIALNTLGTIIHQSLELLYKPYLNQFLSLSDVDFMMALADDVVYGQFREVYKEGEVNKGKNLLAFEVAKRNISNFLKEEKRLLENGDAVKILALETKLERILTHESLPYPVKIAGNVDRIEIRNNVLRIIDYKTGKVEQNQLRISEWLDLTKMIKNDKMIQLLCYAFLYEENASPFQLQAGIVSFKNMKAGFMPFGFKNGKLIEEVITKDIMNAFLEELTLLVAEILNPSIPFVEKNE